MQMNIHTCTAETPLRMQTPGAATGRAEQPPVGAGGSVRQRHLSCQGWHGLGKLSKVFWLALMWAGHFLREWVSSRPQSKRVLYCWDDSSDNEINKPAVRKEQMDRHEGPSARFHSASVGSSGRLGRPEGVTGWTLVSRRAQRVSLKMVQLWFLT